MALPHTHGVLIVMRSTGRPFLVCRFGQALVSDAFYLLVVAGQQATARHATISAAPQADRP